MRADLFVALGCALAAACGSSGDASAPGDGGIGLDAQDEASIDAAIDTAPPPPPPPVCTSPTKPVDVGKPTTVVGDGTAGSCTEAALVAAVASGGIVTFSCGAAPFTLTVTKQVEVTKDTVVDGGNLVTLSGGKSTRILHIKSAWDQAKPLLTVQNLTLVDGFTTDVPNTKATTAGGAAIFEDGGSLTVLHCTFTGNHCAQTGQDVSGGAINGQGVGKLIVVDSVFSGNSGSNGGAVGTQAEDVVVVNSTFANNSANGTDGNPGNGGDGGALTYDGQKNSLTLCGDTFTANHANAAGGAVFRVAYHDEPTTIDRCTFDGNSVDATTGNAGGLYLENVGLDLTDTTIANNTAHFGGGIWIGQSSVAKLQNVTIADNEASGGGGVWFANAVTGVFANVTVAGNTGDGLFGGDEGVKLQNTIVANNVRGTLDGTTNCAKQHGSSGSNLQFPGDGTKCTASITVADPMLGSLADNGGPTKTMLPAAGSPAVGAGSGCPAADQRGKPRKSACTLGAVEVE